MLKNYNFREMENLMTPQELKMINNLYIIREDFIRTKTKCYFKQVTIKNNKKLKYGFVYYPDFSLDLNKEISGNLFILDNECYLDVGGEKKLCFLFTQVLNLFKTKDCEYTINKEKNYIEYRNKKISFSDYLENLI